MVLFFSFLGETKTDQIAAKQIVLICYHLFFRLWTQEEICNMGQDNLVSVLLTVESGTYSSESTEMGESAVYTEA